MRLLPIACVLPLHPSVYYGRSTPTRTHLPCPVRAEHIANARSPLLMVKLLQHAHAICFNPHLDIEGACLLT
jgi:hypothetical protein